MKTIKVLQPSDWSFKPMDEFIAAGGEAFSVSRFGYELIKGNKEIELAVVVPDYDKRITRILTKFLKLEGANLILQLQIIKKARQYDVIYYSADRHPYLVALARKLKIVRTPILLLCHFSYDTRSVDGKLKKLALRLERSLVFNSLDKVIFNCETLMRLADEDYGLPDKHKEISGWGADLKYFSRRTQSDNHLPGPFYFAAGGANRDYKTLIKAFRRLPYRLVLSCPKSIIDEEDPLPSNIIHFDYSKYGLGAHAMLRSFYQDAKAVLIPILNNNHVANGASVFVEAMACGKPILISDQTTNFLNVETEGIGKKVKMWDHKDWMKQIEYLEGNPEKVKLMGERAYEIAQKRYNYQLFTTNIISQFKKMTDSSSTAESHKNDKNINLQ